MAINTDKNSYTVIFAVIMVVIVGSILAYLASGLRPRIDENERFEKQQNILYAMGVNENEGESSVSFVPTTVVEAEFSKYIKEQYVLVNGEVKQVDEAFLIDMKKQLSILKNGGDARLPIFIGEKDGKKSYILPMYGKGLWDAIWGFISVDEKMVVQGVYFDHKAETPGLGANIKMRFFMDDFSGESLLDGNRYAGINVAKGNNDPLNENKSDNEVDALAGATITGNGVSAMIKETINAYKPYLETIRTN
ncbi:MAG: Na(+)-translocating NADH-quinone reductase subunit C [Croceitalea sp.]|nr:Na(+)-translocating NADH-quinone reductase subunit C [Croceitalea sp.]MBT8237018.1 Na(+)-translocating NADH-quinone reductase subunit C [Croceitalea sp.]NNL09195.1 Na(+)-translocating NADH-quinone reductase subunit C [Croceitalea sp.]NNM16954.1 Na(+)-translocating NADH-quinone reductase subunit C [Croceitalea sp.]